MAIYFDKTQHKNFRGKPPFHVKKQQQKNKQTKAQQQQQQQHLNCKKLDYLPLLELLCCFAVHAGVDFVR